jgi:hypothetical protein
MDAEGSHVSDRYADNLIPIVSLQRYRRHLTLMPALVSTVLPLVPFKISRLTMELFWDD